MILENLDEIDSYRQLFILTENLVMTTLVVNKNTLDN